MPETARIPNPNRQLSQEEVHDLFEEKLPNLVDGLADDRDWVWYSGPKPNEADRTAMKALGFGFTPRPHTLGDGRTAHWYHACGGPVLRRRRSGGRSSSHQQDAAGDDAASELARLAALL